MHMHERTCHVHSDPCLRDASCTVHTACGHDARLNLLVTLTYTSSADVFAVTVTWVVSFGIRPEGMRKVIGSFEGPSCAGI